MTSSAAVVGDHYGSGGLLGRIEAALAANGQPVDTLDVEMLYPFDQLHSRRGGARQPQSQLRGGPVAGTSHRGRTGLRKAKFERKKKRPIPHKGQADFGSGESGVDLLEESDSWLLG